jgi:3-deoxy-7-phosphoheptulonate synthase
MGVMVESHLVAGAQTIATNGGGISAPVYGQSITDACLGWEDSVAMLEMLAAAIEGRREAPRSSGAANGLLRPGSQFSG